MTVRVLLVDDQELVRAGFRALLATAPDLAVVAEAGNGEDAVRLAEQVLPDVVLMDIRMPVLDGLAATRRIVAAGRDNAPGVLILTTFDLDEYVYEALRSGASGFLLKDTTAADLLTAIRVVAAGDALLAPSITRRLIEEFAARPQAPSRDALTRLDGLTPRETEVVAQVARGLDNAGVAAELFLSEATVKTHLGRIMAKLHLTSRAQVVVTAYEAGLVVPHGGTASGVSPPRRPAS